MKKVATKKKNVIVAKAMLPEVKKGKTKRQKEEYATIEARVGSLVIVPKEIQAFKNHGIDLLVALKTPVHSNVTVPDSQF